MKLKILECFALHQVQIVILTKDSCKNTFITSILFNIDYLLRLKLTVLESSAEPLQVAIVNIERVTLHLVNSLCYLQEIEESGRRIKDTIQ